MLLTKRDLEQREKYYAANPKKQGNLHERMKWLVNRFLQRELLSTDQELYTAIVELEDEITFYTPANPPFAERIYPISKEKCHA